MREPHTIYLSRFSRPSYVRNEKRYLVARKNAFKMSTFRNMKSSNKRIALSKLADDFCEWTIEHAFIIKDEVTRFNLEDIIKENMAIVAHSFGYCEGTYKALLEYCKGVDAN